MIIDTGCNVAEKTCFQVLPGGEARIGTITNITVQTTVTLADDLGHVYVVPLDQLLTKAKLEACIADLNLKLSNMKGGEK
jgi:hypothetical protein